MLPIPELDGRSVGFDFGLFTVVELSFEDLASLYSEPGLRGCLKQIAPDKEVVAATTVIYNHSKGNSVSSRLRIKARIVKARKINERGINRGFRV